MASHSRLSPPDDDDTLVPRPPAPMLAAAMALISGIIVDHIAATPWPVAAAIALASAAFALRGGRAHIAALMLSLAALGAMRHALATRWTPGDHIVHHAAREPAIVGITGRIISPPQVVEPDETRSRAYDTPPRTRFLLACEAIDGQGGPIAASGRVSIHVGEPVLGLRVGDRVRIAGWLRRPRPPANPGGFDWAQHLRRDRIFVSLSTQHADAVTRLDAPRATASSSGTRARGWRAGLEGLRDRLRGYLLDSALDEDDAAAGVVSAMVLAQRGDVQRAINEAFVRTGNAHFLAASGMQIAWLGLLGWLVLRALGMGYRAVAVVVAGVIASYVVVAEPEPSILRAGIMGLLACGALYRRSLANTTNWLACAAFMVLLIDPADLFRPAFQLSFLAVLGLMHLSPRIADLLGRIPPVERIERAPFARAAHTPYQAAGSAVVLPGRLTMAASWCVRGLRIATGAALGAWLATLPACCYHFDQCTPLGWLGTLLLTIPVFAVTAVGYAKVVLGAVVPSIAAVTGPVLGAASEALVSAVRLMEHIPGMVIPGRTPSLAWTLSSYAWLGVVAWRRDRLPRRAGVALAAALVLWWAIPPRWVVHERDTLLVWMLAVGHGTATLIELPDGRAMLYDCGTRSPFDAGQVMLDLLRVRGIASIDTAFVSHTDFDHYGGIATIARQYPIGRVVVNDHFKRFVEPGSAAAGFLAAMRAAGVEIEVTRGRQSFEAGPGVTMQALWPPPADAQTTPVANDASTVLRIEYAGRAVLLTGDIAEWSMSRLLDDPRALRCDVLALPHHGSVVHNTKAFIDAAGAAWNIRSSGEPGAFTINGIEKLAGAGGEYLNTADAGCVVIRLSRGRTTVECTYPPETMDAAQEQREGTPQVAGPRMSVMRPSRRVPWFEARSRP